MTTFVYYIVDREPYLTSVSYERGDSFEIRIENATPAMIRVGNTVVKAEDGVGRVKLSALSSGVFTPEVIFNDKSVLLYPIRHALGKVTIANPEHICVSLGEKAYKAEVRLREVEGEIISLKDAVYGKDIF